MLTPLPSTSWNIDPSVRSVSIDLFNITQTLL